MDSFPFLVSSKQRIDSIHVNICMYMCIQSTSRKWKMDESISDRQHSNALGVTRGLNTFPRVLRNNGWPYAKATVTTPINGCKQSFTLVIGS